MVRLPAPVACCCQVEASLVTKSTGTAAAHTIATQVVYRQSEHRSVTPISYASHVLYVG